ncbi:MAG: DUF1007 family protein [Thiolinea sp.]
MKQTTVKTLGLGVVLAGLLAGPVQAGGFHYQVLTNAHWLSDGAGNLVGFDMSWLYDPEVSSVILEERERTEAGLNELASDMLNDLDGYGYFTEMRANGQPVQLGQTSDYQLSLEGGQIRLDFTLPLLQAQPIAGRSFTLTLVDRDGTSGMQYPDATAASVDSDLLERCGNPVLSSQQQDLNTHQVDVQSVTLNCK